jgi:hypothetical protein
MNLLKKKRWESRSYLRWVKTLPCSVCGAPADDPHHMKGIMHMSGAGLTSPDYATMPMCRPCHYKMHETPGMWDDQREYVLRTLWQAIDEGRLAWKDGK